MLPVLAKAKRVDFDPPAASAKDDEPPADAEAALRGGNALRKLKTLCDVLQQKVEKYKVDVDDLNKIVDRLEAEKKTLKDELLGNYNKIATFRSSKFQEDLHKKRLGEVEKLLIEERRRRLTFEDEISKHKELIIEWQSKYEELREQFEENLNFDRTAEDVINTQRERIEELESIIRGHVFDADELRTLVAKNRNFIAETERQLQEVTLKNEILEKAEKTITAENKALQEKTRELLDLNNQLTENYVNLKNKYMNIIVERDETIKELADSRAACEVAAKHKLSLQGEMNNLLKQRKDLNEKILSLEASIITKQRELAETIEKHNQTIAEYESKLARKEEQMWAITSQLNQVEAQRTEEKAKPAVTSNNVVDVDYVASIEKKWQARERTLLSELEKQSAILAAKDDIVSSLKKDIDVLKAQQFEPRMERLKAIEKDIKSRLEEYAIAEDSLETGFMCGKCLDFFKKPVSFSPCGHTYCEGCVEIMREECYDKFYCDSCQTEVATVYRNEQIEAMEGHFERRKSLTLSFISWIKALRVHLPSIEKEKMIDPNAVAAAVAAGAAASSL